MKFDKDRRLWLKWLFEARKRFGLSLLVGDNGEGVIPQSMQLIAGKLGQEYNRRKNRKGAYWEDRYHATAVETDKHLIQCMVYIDMNMVRAGVVKHPQEWPYGGYYEIQSPRQRYAFIDCEGLKEILNFKTTDELAQVYRGWTQASLIKGDLQRDSKWTESVAVGSELFVTATKEKLGIRLRAGTYLERMEVTNYESKLLLTSRFLGMKRSL